MSNHTLCLNYNVCPRGHDCKRNPSGQIINVHAQSWAEFQPEDCEYFMDARDNNEPINHEKN